LKALLYWYICQEYGYIHLSAGELLRAERKKPDSEVGLLIEKHIQEGSIVPVEITCRLLQQVTLKSVTEWLFFIYIINVYIFKKNTSIFFLLQLC